ncbi:CheA signal transduction histidine kinase [Gloeothece citriformis PCC 7424]|uniref:histidine kinase n=1 Tax=Gloeothece citriformis (strain PCC 7424) TaxID=65393 RepID=B7K8K3_GLOC7|nr:hybrid sensor histidine kinase/response regulator [Gloeothece citriformis]ACK71201.1 CheA signal transduction histidine kinase [Gloeothece citriformis PCC 7424]
MNSEQQVKLHFLDEANDYLSEIESGVLGLSKATNQHLKTLDSSLRAAHSIKGGAAMMGYKTLSFFAHRLEDFLKVIKAHQAKQVDRNIERLLLESLDCLRKIINFYHQGNYEIDQSWLETEVNPIFAQLYSHLGEPTVEETTKLISAEAGNEEIIELLFQTEVNTCLQRLEEVLNSPEKICLKEEFALAAQELGGLGEMLELKSFSLLCENINHHLENANHENQIGEICRLSLQALRRSQALILVGQKDKLPSAIEWEIPWELENGQPEVEELEMVAIDLEELEHLENLEVSTEDFSFLNEENFEEDLIPLMGIETFNQVEIHQDYEELEPPSFSEASESENTIRVGIRQLEELSDLVGELTIERNGLNLQLSSLRDLFSFLKTRLKTLDEFNFNLRTLYDQAGNWETAKLTEVGLTRKPDPLTALVSQSVMSSSNSVTSIAPPFLGSLWDQLEMDRYGQEHLFLQELMEKIVQIQEVAEDINLKLEDTRRKASNLTRTSKLLQDHVTKVRMRPFSDLVNGFPRAIREMELRYGKQVQLKINGSSTLIDRQILEALKDPLIHLLRNAFDHGIETPNERIKKGKLPVGTIEVSAGYRGNQTVISLKDDGAGINLEKIRLAAFEMGLDEATLVKASQKELLDLIFEPGFTTASQVTDLSGRGVGMDVVRTQVKQIRGQIHIDTIPGEGTTFMISVPFTLSVVRVLLVESGGIMFAFPSTTVEEMIIADPQMVVTSAGIDYLRWDEGIIPLYSLRDWLHFSRSHFKPQTEAMPTIDRPVVLIVTQGNETVALQMDSFWGEQEVSIRAIEGPIKLPAGFTGCTILGDGRVVPLVDTAGLLRLIEQNRSGKETAVLWTESESSTTTSHSFQEEETNSSNQPLSSQRSSHLIALEKATIMVVDDSINIRRFMALTLEKVGYRVQQARDGQEAIDKLKKGLPIAAVICDIEMPRLDGYGFLAQVKSEPMFRSLPVIMLTSRSGEKHREMALNLGASAYFSKPFQAQELLQALKGLITKK